MPTSPRAIHKLGTLQFPAQKRHPPAPSPSSRFAISKPRAYHPLRSTAHPPNHLIDSTSPYLLQHAHNPVDWHPWSPATLARARTENKPIFLSIGYSACHWCHVMERECFENPDIAALMNAHFINIKVDREERPDLDELYMLATQIMSGSGGWPMSVWLTPTLEPFFAGTYFPPADGFGRPGFPKLTLALADAWKNRRPQLLEQAQKVVDAIRLHADESQSHTASANIDLKSWFATSLEQFADRFDQTHGGLGSAPKFPPHQALHLWLAMLRHPSAAQLAPADIEALNDMTTKTLDVMMHGGIYDHLAGAFARYSTDELWLVPHFEKMLYDNAQLAPAYALASVHFNRPDYAHIARQTLDFFLREMCLSSDPASPTTHGGAFFSSLDADSEGHEGQFYVWNPTQIREAIPNESDAALVIEHFGLTETSNWPESPIKGASVLAIPIENRKLKIENSAHLDSLLLQLRQARSKRIPPALDDKILTSWNALMISALAITGKILHEPKYLEAAHRAVGYLLTIHTEAGKKLLRVSRNRQAHIPAFLEDHAYLLNALMDLIDSTLPTSLPGTMARKRALELADTLIQNFADPKNGGFYFTSSSHDQLFARMKNAADNATPSPNAVAIRALLRLARSSGKEQYRETALAAVHAFAPNIQRRPDFFPTLLQALLEDAEAHAAAPAAPAPLPIALHEPSHPHIDSILQLSLAPLPPITPGQPFQLHLDIAITPGYHIQPHHPADKENFATVARLRSATPAIILTSQSWTYPPPPPNTPAGYSGKIRLTALCTFPEKTPPGVHPFRVTLLAQPCTQTSCLPPTKVTLDFPLTIK